jgi:hypothetical protein
VIFVGRSERGNKQNFILGLTDVIRFLIHIAVESKLRQPGAKRKSIIPSILRKPEVSQDPTAQELKIVFAPSYRDVCIDMYMLWYELSIKLPCS